MKRVYLVDEDNDKSELGFLWTESVALQIDELFLRFLEVRIWVGNLQESDHDDDVISLPVINIIPTSYWGSYNFCYLRFAIEVHLFDIVPYYWG